MISTTALHAAIYLSTGAAGVALGVLNRRLKRVIPPRRRRTPDPIAAGTIVTARR